MRNGETLTPETRQRLLEAAGEVFAEHGFRAATVRDICQRANVNIAAVNYHFGDKERLYAEVLRYAHHCCLEKYPPDFGLQRDASAEQRLHAFVRSFLLRIFDEGRLAWYGQLMSHEMIEPTAALDALVETEIRPGAEQLQSIVRVLLGRRVNAEQVRLCAMSIVSQCLHYHHARPVITRLFPQQRYELKDIERLADHITHFSLAALTRLAEERKGRTS
ncbi:MAG: CerR family C-terminal domain-containing protein [Candidatus Binatia bacterium]